MKKGNYNNKINILNESDEQISYLYNGKFEDAFELFIQAKVNENLKERTIKDHKQHFKYFTTFLYKHKPDIKKVNDLTSTTISDYISYMKNEKRLWDNHPDLKKTTNTKGLSATTINIRLRTLKTQLKFWHSKSLLEQDLSQEIKLLKVDKTNYNKINKEYIKRLLNQIDRFNKYTDLRDYVLLLILIDSGPRIEHILSVNLDDVDLIRKEIYLPTEKSKNRNDYIITFSNETKKWLSHLIKQNIQRGFNKGKLFLTVKGTIYKANSFRKRLKNYAIQAGIPDDVKINPHSFRHYFATKYLKNGGNVFELKDLLGHSSLASTIFYIDNDIEHLKIAHSKYSPLSEVI